MHFDISGITHITQDSRDVQAGSLFAALKGEKVDGVQCIAQVEAACAVAVLVAEDAVIPPTKMRVIRAANPRLALAHIAATFYPKQPKYMVAVTGTDGKTSTTDFFRQLAHLAGYKSASIGTLGVFAGDGTKLYDGTHTTPDAIALHRMLQELAEAGYTHVCMEASSHGLDQYRLHGVRLTAAAFTNIARDHMDYHKTDEAYFAAKMKLFREFDIKTAVVNAAFVIPTKVGIQTIDFGMGAKEFRIQSITPHAHGQRVECVLRGQPHALEVPLVGAFQVMNILAALGLLVGCGESLEKLLPLIAKLQGVAGRLEHVATTKNGASVFVDYAHTPAALENILKTLRPHTQNKLHIVFGCGGNRDVGKRPLMGKAAYEFADCVIVTDDNPRSEDPAEIRKAILAECPKAQEIGDRKEAIRTAIAELAAGDVLVIAGKGHEKTQIIGDKELPHDDAEVARNVI